MIWEVIEKSISESERESRKKRASSEREKLQRKEKDRNDLRKSSHNILQKRKRNGKRKYIIRRVVRVRELRQAGGVTPQPESDSESETGGLGGRVSPLGWEVLYDPKKGGAQGGGGSLDTLPPSHPVLG